MRTNHWIGAFAAGGLIAGAAYAANEGDPHYNAAGFFDIHVCNWPDRPNFLMALFSTVRFDEVAKISVYAPDGRHVGDLDLDRYRAFKTSTGQPKRAFIKHLGIPEKAQDGWYRGEITLKDGSRFEGRDYVIHHVMAHPAGVHPAPDAVDVPADVGFRWDPIPGARHYQVFVRDDWNGSPPFTSKLLSEPHFQPPPGLLQPGGAYLWRIHARDGDGNVLLGDFNHGSLSPEMSFTVK